jgi:GAF domain
MKKRSKAANQSAKAPHRKAGRSIPRAMPSCGSAPARETEVARLTRERDEAQEQQTATSEVLQVISSSSGELEPVFSTLLESAVRICEAKFGMLYLHEGGGFRPVAARDVPPMFAEALWGRRDFLPAPGGVLESVMKTRRTVHVSDLAATQAYLERHPSLTAGVELGGIRTVVGIPMLTGDELVGVIGIYRQEVRSFTEKQIALLTSLLLKLSSPSRTRDCSTNCVSAPTTSVGVPLTLPRLWNSRQPRQRFFRLSVAPPATLSRYFPQCSRMPFASATLRLEISTVGTARRCYTLLGIIPRLHTLRHVGACRRVLVRGTLLGG